MESQIPHHQQVIAVLVSTGLLAVVVDLVRRRRLGEEYAWLWIFMAGVTLVFSVRLDWLVALTMALGAKVPASGVYFLGLVCLFLTNLHFSVKASQLSERVRILTQRLALLEAEMDIENQAGGVAYMGEDKSSGSTVNDS